jgi:membrane fusion protein (multidrug efflux system)
MSSKLKRIVFVIILALVGVGIYIFMHLGQQDTDDATIEAHVVSISPKVSGYVKSLRIVDNQFVKAGDLLLEIDPTDYIIRRDRAKATLQAAQAGHMALSHTLETTQVSAPSNLTAAEAQVAAAQANWVKASNDLKRLRQLNDEARSRQQLDEAIANEKTTLSSLEDAKARLKTAQTAPKTIATAKSNADEQEAQVKQAQADLAQAEKDLADTKIIATQDGRIIKSGVEAGNYVQPGQQLGYIVGTELWVVANYKETQLTDMKPGQKVDISVDAFPSAKVEGRVDSIQAGTGGRFSAFPPENATGNYVKIVQRVPVKILITSKPDASLPLGPGMSVVPTVFTR